MKTVIEATNKTPKIVIDKSLGTVHLQGILIPENPIAHFEYLNPMIFDCYDASNSLTLEFDLEYFNTSSAKYLYDLLKQLKSRENIKIVWHYDSDDEDILESGQEFQNLTGLKFEFRVK